MDDHFGLTFLRSVWLNAETTALALIVVPILPAVRMNRREGKRRKPHRETPW